MTEEIKDLFLNSEEYKKAKIEYEKCFFKLRGEYCAFKNNKIINYSPNQISEYFKNKCMVLKNEVVEEVNNPKYNTRNTKTSKISKSFYEIWSRDPSMKEYEDITFEPNPSLIHKNTFNLFTNFNQFDHLEKKTVDLSPVFDHIRSLVGYDETVFNYMIAWTAQIIQRPWELPHKCPVIISEVGVGKDEYNKFLTEVIGSEYCLITDKIDNVCGKFNNLIAGKFLIVLNETNPADTKDRIENIKSLVTAKKVILEAKYKDPVSVNNYGRVMFFSNRNFCFPVEAGARRPLVVKSSTKYLDKLNGGTLTTEEKNIHFNNLIHNILENKDYQYAFLRYLKDYDIQNFNFQQEIKTDFHVKLEANSASPLTLFLSTLIEKHQEEVQEHSPKFLFEQYNIFLKENKFRFEDNIKTFLFNLTELYKIKYAKKYEKTSLKLMINRKELKETLIVKFKVNFDEIDCDGEHIVEEDREKIIINELQKENNLLRQQIDELKLLLSQKSIDVLVPKLELIIKPIINEQFGDDTHKMNHFGDDISVLTESTTQSKKIVKVLKFNEDRLDGLTDKEILEFLNPDRISKFSKTSQLKALEIVKLCEDKLAVPVKRVYNWKDISDFVLNQQKLDYLLKAYNEYTEESQKEIDEIIRELTIKVNRMKAFETGDIETGYDCNSEYSNVAPKNIKKYKSRGKIVQEVDIDNFEL